MKTAPISSSQTNLQNTIKVSQKMQPAMRVNSSYTTMNMQKMQNPSFGWFGVDDLFYYYSKKLNNKREEERKEQIRLINNKIYNDIESVARKNKISVKEATAKFNKSLEIGGIEINRNGEEVGLNKIVGYPTEKLTLIKDVVAPIVASQTDQDLENNPVEKIPNGVVIYGSNGRGKTYFVKSLLEHLNYKKENTASYGTKDHLNIRTETIVCDSSMMPDLNNSYFIKSSFREAKKFHEATGGHTIIFIDDLELITNEEKYPETASEFIVQASNAAKNGITWVGTLVSPKLVPKWVFMPELTNITVPLKELEDSDKSAVMSYFWAQNNRLDKSDHNFAILSSKDSNKELAAPMFSKIAKQVDFNLLNSKDYKTPKRGEYRAPVDTQAVVDGISNYGGADARANEKFEIDKLNKDAEKYINDIKEEYSAD